jgi:membrane-bound hydrogenase subunit alpha
MKKPRAKNPEKKACTPAESVTIPIGPQHPALKEPECFIITLDGEKIRDMNFRLGYNHRGVEKAAEGRTYIQDLYLVERVCGICSHSHSTCFAQAVEELAGVEIPKRAAYIRVLFAELERIHSHLLWLGVAGHEVGFDTLLMYSWRDREAVMDILADISGNRVNYGMNTLGGVRRDVSPEQKERTLKAVDLLEERTKYYIQLALEETTLIKRLSSVGVLSHEDAVRLGTIGPTGRASGVDRDTRRDDPYAAYEELDFKVIVDNHNDVYGRVVVRLLELMESYKIIRQVLKNMPDGPLSVKVPRRIPAGEAFSRYEAPRGEDVHYIRSNGTDKPERAKLRAPTLANLHAVPVMLRDNNLADSPIVIAAIDPCFSCTDRMVVLSDQVAGLADSGITDFKGLRDYSIRWYARQGLDFTDLNRRFRVP